MATTKKKAKVKKVWPSVLHEVDLKELVMARRQSWHGGDEDAVREWLEERLEDMNTDEDMCLYVRDYKLAGVGSSEGTVLLEVFYELS